MTVFLTIHFSKGVWWKSIFKHHKNDGVQSQPCLNIREIPCPYFIFSNTGFLIKYSYRVTIFSISINNHSQGFGAKYWVKFPHLVLSPIVIICEKFNSSIMHKDLTPLTPLPLKTNDIKNSWNYAIIHLYPSNPKPTSISPFYLKLNILNYIKFKIIILKDIYIINRGITEYVIHIFPNIQRKVSFQSLCVIECLALK